VENVYTHTWMADLLFHNFHFPHLHLVGQLVFRAEVPPDLVKLQQFVCASSWSADALLYHFGMGGSRVYDFCKPLPGVFPLQLSLSNAQETQLLASSLLRLWRKVS
jgi:hypothetical protein